MLPNYRESEAMWQKNDLLETDLRTTHELLLEVGFPGCPPRFSNLSQWLEEKRSASGGFGKPPSAGVRMPRNKKYRLSPI